jgi:RNA polymerase sigma-70 factor (ECF subfamily)
MKSPPAGDITQLLISWGNGDRDAFDKLTPLVYDELRRIARGKLRKHSADVLLQPTALVHEAYIKLVDETRVQWRNRAHFYAIAANTIRSILVDNYRKRLAEKRGGGANFVSLEDGDAIAPAQKVDLLALHEALEKLSALGPRQAEIIEMRFFGGLANDEIAEALKISLATVERETRTAKAWLHSQLS